MKLRRTVDFTITMADVAVAMQDGRCRHHLVEAAAKRIGLPLEYHRTGAVNLKGNDSFAQSSELGSGRALTNPDWKLQRFKNILQHSVIRGRRVRVKVVATDE
jgi:hypothetical protein